MGNSYAIVTGGTKGIGRAIVRQIATLGLSIVTCSRNNEDLEAVAEEMSIQSIHCLTYNADLSKSEDVDSFGKYVLANCQDIRILVNNAGVFFPGSILTEEEGQLQLMLNTNLLSAYRLTRMIAPRMVEKGRGHIFNICSIASQIAYPNGGSYSISKFAMLGFSKVLREELKDTGVKVTSMLPGATWSASWQGVDLPESRLMQAKDIADLLVSCYQLSPSAVVEDVVIRPQLGDL